MEENKCYCKSVCYDTSSESDLPADNTAGGPI